MAAQTVSASVKECVRSSSHPVTSGAAEAIMKLPKFCRALTPPTSVAGLAACATPQPEVPANCMKKRALAMAAIATVVDGVCDDERTCCGEGEADHSEGAVDAHEVFFFACEPVGQKAAAEDSTRGHEKGHGCGPAAAFKREVARCLEVSGKPGDIEPVGVVDAAEAEHHPPHRTLPQEQAPRKHGGGWAFVNAVFGGRAFAVERNPEDGDGEARRAEEDEHASPADVQHEDRQQRRSEREAQRGRDVERRGGAASAAMAEPLTNTAYACGIERSFADAEENAQEQKHLQAVHEAGEHLCGGPDGEGGAHHPPRTDAVEQADEWKLREAVGERKDGEQKPHLRGAEVHLRADGGVGDGERGAVEEVDQACGEEQRKRGGLVPQKAARCSALLHRGTLSAGRGISRVERLESQTE